MISALIVLGCGVVGGLAIGIRPLPVVAAAGFAYAWIFVFSAM